jgi:hypothetical protein
METLNLNLLQNEINYKFNLQQYEINYNQHKESSDLIINELKYELKDKLNIFEMENSNTIIKLNDKDTLILEKEEIIKNMKSKMDLQDKSFVSTTQKLIDSNVEKKNLKLTIDEQILLLNEKENEINNLLSIQNELQEEIGKYKI